MRCCPSWEGFAKKDSDRDSLDTSWKSTLNTTGSTKTRRQHHSLPIIATLSKFTVGWRIKCPCRATLNVAPARPKMSSTKTQFSWQRAIWSAHRRDGSEATFRGGALMHNTIFLRYKFKEICKFVKRFSKTYNSRKSMKMLHKVILCFHCVTKCPFNMSPYIKTQDCTLEAGQNDWLLLHVTRDGLFLIGPCQGLCA